MYLSYKLDYYSKDFLLSNFTKKWKKKQKKKNHQKRSNFHSF